MQSIRVRVPTQAYRVNRLCPAATTSSRSMSLFPRLVHNEFAQVARFLDDMSQFQQVTRQPNHYYYNNAFFATPPFRSFQPRFDVKESQDAYELTGELPGCTDINVEFTDASTLTVRGRSSHSREEGSPPAALAQGGNSNEQTQPAAASTDDTVAEQVASSASSVASDASYHKASVEDEDAEGSVTAASEAVNTPATTTVEPATQQLQQEAQQQQQQQEQSKYWVSERSVGEFTRTFTFPARVDQEAVRATLKDGILSVTVPKAAKATRKINIE